MKILIILIVFINLKLLAQEPWFFDENPYSVNSYPFVQFINNDIGWLYPTSPSIENPSLFKTTDGGANWFFLSSILRCDNPIHAKPFLFTDSDTGYYYSRWSDYKYKMWKTIDGGINWVNIYSFPTYTRPDYTFFINGKDGWIILSRGIPAILEILRTDDGGLTWAVLDTFPKPAYSSKLQFFNISNGIFLHEDYYGSSLYKTSDGGLTWAIIKSWNTRVTSIRFKNENIGYATYSDNLYRTSDGGVNWSAFNLSGYNVSKVEINRDSVIALYGYRTYPFYKTSLHVSSNNGVTWTTSEFNANIIYSMFIFNSDKIFLCKDKYLIKASNLGSVWAKIPIGPTYNLTGISFNQSGQPFAVGWKQDSLTNNYESAIISYSPLWRTKSIHPNLKFNFLASKNDSEIFIVGRNYANGGNALILKCNNEGDSIHIKYSSINPAINGINFLNSTIGFAVGDNGIILKTTNGGDHWFELQNVTNENLNTVFFDSQIGFVGGTNGLVMKTTDEGLTWSFINTGITKDIKSIYIKDNNILWIVGKEGLLMKSENQGLSWLSTPIQNEHHLNTITAIDSYITVIFGENIFDQTGVMYQSTNSGKTWNIKQLPQTNGINLAIKSSNDKVWAVGNNGTIIKSNVWYVPVELSSFAASSSKNTVYLAWSTASELNNYGFEIERKDDKTDLPDVKAGWRTIGFREGKGTSTEQQNYSYTDDLFGVNAHKLYYRLKQIDYDGQFEYSNVLEVEVTPLTFALYQNYPNPFNPSTKISWQSPVGSHQTVKVFDVLGREVATLVDEYKEAGYHEVEFNTSSGIRNLPAGRQGLASGIYFYQLRTGNYIATKKMMVIR
jgi:photosystem II stability/assembly factor-like uncharacterized protein